MIATIAVVLGGFAFLVLRAYRSAGTYRTEGKLRWTDDPARDPARPEA